MIVVDASTLVDALLWKGPAVDRLEGELLCAPYLIDAEFVSSVRTNLNQGTITSEDADAAVDDIAGMDLLRYQHTWLLGRVWELRHNLTPYDALYVALAEELDEVLVTSDARLAKAPRIRARVEVLPASA